TAAPPPAAPAPMAGPPRPARALRRRDRPSPPVARGRAPAARRLPPRRRFFPARLCSFRRVLPGEPAGQYRHAEAAWTAVVIAAKHGARPVEVRVGRAAILG